MYILRVYAKHRGEPQMRKTTMDVVLKMEQESRAEESLSGNKKSNTYRVHDQGGREMEGGR